DVLIIEQFLDKNGKLLPQHYSKVCLSQYLHLQEVVHQANAAGLLIGHERPKRFLKIPHYQMYYSWFQVHKLYKHWFRRM
ncbi:MAG: rRNA binding, partial [Paramarteilia canceri]